VADQLTDAADRVAETVRKALSLVGPPEHAIERVAEESSAEETPA
jgi:hypothetical protein